MDALDFIIRRAVQGASLPALTIVVSLLFRKWRTSKNAEGKRDMVPFLAFFSVFWWTISIYLSFFENVIGGPTTNRLDSINLVSMSVVFSLNSGASFAAYVYHRREYILMPWYAYAGILLYEFLTKNGTGIVLQYGLIMIGDMVLLVFLYTAGFKYRDNKVLGLGVFFTFPFFSWLTALIPYVIINGGVAVFGLIYAAGKANFFRAPKPDAISRPEEPAIEVKVETVQQQVTF